MHEPVWYSTFDGLVIGCYAEPLTGIVRMTPMKSATLGTFVMRDHLCPDLLRYEQIGAADNWRGRTVRAFFWLMRVWSVE